MGKFYANLKAMLKKWNWQLFFSVCAFIASIFTVFIIVYGNLRSDITPYVSEGLVLIFVGVLATFVVVSNHAQVIEVKNEFDKRISDIENLAEKMKELKAELGEKTTEIEKLGEEIDRLEVRLDSRIKEMATTWG